MISTPSVKFADPAGFTSRNQYVKFHVSPTANDIPGGKFVNGIAMDTEPVAPEFWIDEEKRTNGGERQSVPWLRGMAPCCLAATKIPNVFKGSDQASSARLCALRRSVPRAIVRPGTPVEFGFASQ